MMKKKSDRGVRVGLALGGGGARAICHIGVIEALQKAGVKFDLISGTSMGAVVGAYYALHREVHGLKNRLRHFFTSSVYADAEAQFTQFLRRARQGRLFHRLSRVLQDGYAMARLFHREALIPPKLARRVLEMLVDDVPVEKTQLPFAAVGCDLARGEPLILQRGRMIDVLRASCAIPGIFAPVQWRGRPVVDGGWVQLVPVEAARALGAQLVIAVSVEGRDPFSLEQSTSYQIYARSNQITRDLLCASQLERADCLIRIDTAGVQWYEFKRLNRLVELGKQRCLAQLDDIMHSLRRARRARAPLAGRLLRRSSKR